jgi:hypothetical protein
MSAFDFDYAELKGILTCTASFVDPNCNHLIACADDCASSTCIACKDPSSNSQCQAQELTSGSCTSFVQNAAGCLATALILQAQVCNPNPGLVGAPEPFGQWLGPVVAEFCGQ